MVKNKDMEDQEHPVQDPNDPKHLEYLAAPAMPDIREDDQPPPDDPIWKEAE